VEDVRDRYEQSMHMYANDVYLSVLSVEVTRFSRLVHTQQRYHISKRYYSAGSASVVNKMTFMFFINAFDFVSEAS